MRLERLLLGRVLLAALTLLLVSVMIFAIVEVLPGDVAHRILGRSATAENLALMREQLHLNDPAVERYFRWLGGVLQGDFGRSLVSDRPVSEILGPRVLNTLLLSGFAFLLYIPMSLAPAIVQAVRRDQPIDHILSIITLGLLSVPDFLLATILLLGFVAWIPLFSATSAVGDSTPFFAYLRALVLPGTTLAIVMAVYAIRMLRDNLIEVLDSDYVRMAELKGLPPRRVVLRHALPNAIVPSLNVTAINIGHLIGGVMIVEKVYAFPGFGSLLVDSIRLLDVAVIEAAVLFASATFIGANLVVDILAILLNPRLRVGSP
jgi:peptide/nickel transport system permease protein